MRACTSCGTEQPEEKYKKNGKRRHTMCNRCLYVRYTRPVAERKTKTVQDYKVSKGCVDCGFNEHPAALEFDHLPGMPKSFNIGEKIGCYSMERIWAEIAKCEVVCANCHAIRTVERRARVELAVS